MYVLDTNCLFKMQENYFPNLFISLWKGFNQLIDDGELISLKEVQKEVKYEHQIKFWNEINDNHNGRFFVELQGEQLHFKEIEALSLYDISFEKRNKNNNKVYTTLREEWSDGQAVADPFLICYALHHNATLVTLESQKNDFRIPNVCKKLNVNCIDSKQFFTENKDVFNLG